jgi:hypothetical protein
MAAQQYTINPPAQTGDLTAAVVLGETQNNTSGTSGNFDSNGLTLTLNVVEEPAAYFVLLKTAGQTITVDGTDASYVTQVTASSGNTSLDGSTASATMDLFSVNMEDLLFDGAFGETDTFNANAIPSGTEVRAFTLTVSENGKDSREIAVNLNITLDQTTETSIYHREGVPNAYYYVKVRDAALTEADRTNYINENYAFIAFDEGTVRNLQNAFVWADHYGLGGNNHTGFENGTTEGYSEYRLFLKKNQQIGRITFVIVNEQKLNDTRDNMSIELYGAGLAGQKKLEITRNDSYCTSRTTQSFNYDTTQSFITLGKFNNASTKYTTLVLGKNITINAKASATDPNTASGSTLWAVLRAVTLFEVYNNSMLIMNNNAKITGYYNTANLSPITVSNSTSGKFYMYGGEITGNFMVSGRGAIRANTVGTTGPQVYLTGGTISNTVVNSIDENNTKVSIP